MELDQIRAFVMAVEAGSIQGAAQRLHRSQPAATRLIQSLESSLGGSLLDRRTRPATPTEFGRQVLEPARRTLDAADRLVRQSRREVASQSLTIRLGVSHAYIRIVASPRVSAVLVDRGRSRLSIQSGWSLPLLRHLQDQFLDAALVSFPPAWSCPANLRSQLIRKEELVVIAPQATIVPAAAELKDLAPYPWVLNTDGCGLRSQIQAAFAEQGRGLDLRIEIAGTLSQHIDFVAAGFGLGLVPLRALAIHPSRKRVRRVHLKKRLWTHLWLLWHEMEGPLDEEWARTRVAVHRSATARAL